MHIDREIFNPLYTFLVLFESALNKSTAERILKVLEQVVAYCEGS